MLSQENTPLFDALKKYMEQKTISFHVPGHKHGAGNPELLFFLGKNALNIDLTIMPDLDSIMRPTGVIKLAEELAAEAFGADRAFFLVNGTSSGIQAMIMAACREGDRILLPRNVHKSVISSLILSGAEPVYIRPKIDEEFGIAMGITAEDAANAIRKNPEARALFVINTTYYGVASPLQKLVELAHGSGMAVLVDEAHGAHLKFHESLPICAMEAGADMAASSTHKLAGSLTQSSMLLLKGERFSPSYVKSVLNLSQTTSPSYILLASLDIARKNMALNGKKLLSKVISLARWARLKINSIPGLSCMDTAVLGLGRDFSLDPTKLCINVKRLGITGYEASRILRKKFHIQVELSDFYNILAVVSIGDTKKTVSALVDALGAMAREFGRGLKSRKPAFIPDPPIPEPALLPREAFYSPKRPHPFRESAGKISGEMIMAYPPGIPIVCPGEIITRDIIDEVLLLKDAGGLIQGAEDEKLEYIRVIK
ncbi:aminotransferase class I/II-fold pyridoxal phosphate-dependent enzyme [Thermoanaerobacterium sp. DL9XJH110]|uniref:aminotransferase class I/II-fold pyridoxal phosphate-dependent enzyme n=1 Tax=Thermoanaerobacterium sp. DL9XJH110 TaxID=3386643 RepID=UPI003BB75C94